MKKILFLTKWYPNKNDLQLGIFVQKHAAAVALYAEVIVLHITYDTALKKGWKIVTQRHKNLIEITIYHPQNKNSLQAALRYVQAQKKGWQLINSQFGLPDVVHVHVLTRPALLAYYLKKRHQIPYFISEHWSGFLTKAFQQKNVLAKWLSRYLAKQSVGVSAVSAHLQKAMEMAGIAPVQFVIPNVVERAASASNSASVVISLPKLASNTVHLLTVGDLYDGVKNISGIIKSVHHIVATHPQKLFQLHIIGGGEDAAMLKKMAADLGILNTSVIFYGRQSNAFVLAFMQQIHFLIINSHYETFSMVAAESILAGKPVIATKCGGPEQFVNDVTGILIAPDNSSELERAILKMLANYPTYDAQKLKDTVKNRFSKAAVGEAFMGFYGGYK